jgi:pimeloyl-ACP methyl ester carboxylesterase
VLVHTLRTQLEYFDRLLEHLDTGKVEVFAIDLPGHGKSSAPAVEYTADYFTESVAAFLDRLALKDVVVVGESIGGTIALALAARHEPRMARVIAVNPYDYGRRGGIRRSSPLANVLFTAILWPGVGPIVARASTPGILRRVMEGGLYDASLLPAALIDEMYRCGRLPGHARAFRSLNMQWRTWVAARSRYREIGLPVTLVYGSDDWSRPDEREANARTIPGVRTVSLERCGHFASLEKPDAIARLIDDAA